jgi:hypothetical protein
MLLAELIIMFRMTKGHVQLTVTVTNHNNVIINLAETRELLRGTAQAIANGEATLGNYFIGECVESDKETCLQDYYRNRGWIVEKTAPSE